MLKKLTLISFLCVPLLMTAQEYEYTHTLFINSPMEGDYFYSSTFSRGGSSIKNINGKLPVSEEVFHTPGNALELNYHNASGGDWNAVVYQHEIRGMDRFRKPAYLSFWIYNPSPEATESQFPRLQFRRSDQTLTEGFRIPAGQANRWEHVLIPLDLMRIMDTNALNITGIVFSQSKGAVAGTHTLYVDDIEFIPEGPEEEITLLPVIRSVKGYVMHVDIAWNRIEEENIRFVKIYRSEDGREYQGVGIQQPFICRYADYTGMTGKQYWYRISFLDPDYNESALSEPVEATTRPMSDEELLSMVQEASFRYYWEGAEASSGMARENIPGRHNMIATGASGFGIMALIVGTERGFITREESVNRFLKILDFLEKAESFHGAFPHFMDGPSGKAEPFFGLRDNGADLVETSFLMQGLLAARQYFSGSNENEQSVREKITGLWEKVEWDWFKRYPGGKFLFWHWSPDQHWVIDHRLIGWNETMVVYLLAIASPAHPVPPKLYYTGWASQDSIAQKYRMNWGQSADGSMYANGKTYYGIILDVGVNNGGPLFFIYYSYMGYDPHLITDRYTNYFVNNQNIAKINHHYCMANPKQFKGYGDEGWGLTASDGPYDYSADEPVQWQDHGKLTPTGAIASFPYTPEESMKALKNYYYNYGHFLWGEFGFRDAFSLTDNWCSEIYMGLNQAPMTVMIENYRTGLIWKLFMQDPEIQQGLKRLDEETKKE
jgi:hypothetical protein